MKRRTLLLGILPALAGCNARPTERPQSTTAVPTDTGSQTSKTGYTLPIADTELVRSAPRDGIPAIVNPTFAPSWDGIEIDLDGETPYVPDSTPTPKSSGSPAGTRQERTLSRC